MFAVLPEINDDDDDDDDDRAPQIVVIRWRLKVYFL